MTETWTSTKPDRKENAEFQARSKRKCRVSRRFFYESDCIEQSQWESLL